jgi:hypothetical protein
MKYNKSLDQLASAVLNFNAGKVLTASTLFAEACSEPSIAAALAAIESTNGKAFKAMTAARSTDAKATKAKLAAARIARKSVKASDEEMDLLEDEGELDLEAAGEEGGEGWPFTAEIEGEDLELEAADDSEDSEELELDTEEDEDEEEDPEQAAVAARKVAQARFARALVNIRAAAAKKKKKVVKKK